MLETFSVKLLRRKRNFLILFSAISVLMLFYMYTYVSDCFVQMNYMHFVIQKQDVNVSNTVKEQNIKRNCYFPGFYRKPTGNTSYIEKQFFLNDRPCLIYMNCLQIHWLLMSFEKWLTL